MYFIYSKIPLEGKFWEINNIKIYGVYNNSEDAEKIQTELAHNYIHQQNESGYKIRKENDIYIISKDREETSKGYFYNSIYIRKIDVISFHIAYSSEKTIIKSEIKLDKVITQNNNNNHMKLVVQQMKEAFEKGLELRKLN